MTLRRWLFEGYADGTAATTTTVVSTPAGGSASQVTGAGATFTHSTTYAQSDTSSIKFVIPASVTAIARLPLPASNMQFAVSFYHYATALPATDTAIFGPRYSSGSAFKVAIRTNGAVRITDSVNAFVVDTAAGAWKANQWNRIEVVGTIATATTGIATVRVFTGNSTTALGSASTSTSNFGTNPIVAVDIGIPGTAPTGGWTTYVDAVQADDGATAEIGPYTSNTISGTPTLTTNLAEIDATILTGGVASLTHSISPSSGVLERTEGLFVVQQGASSVSYTITSTDGVTSLVNTVVVPAAVVTTDNLRERIWTGSAWA